MCSDRILRLAALALGATVLWACAPSGDTRQLSASIASVEPVCGDTARATPIVLRGSFPVAPRVSLSDPTDSSLDTTYRAWLGDVELLGVTWQGPGALAATIPVPFVAGVYPLSVEGPWHERVTARDGFEIRAGGCSGTPGALAVTASVAPNAVTVGQQVSVTATVRNAGQHTLFDVDAAVSVAPPGVAPVTGQTGPRDVAGGESTTFTWTYDTTAVTGPEGASFVVTASGVDDLGAAVAAEGTTNAFLINLPANVTAHTHAPAAVDPEQVITFTLDLSNTGAAPALVTATLTVNVAGAASVRRLSSPAPQTVPGLGERSLVWTFSADGPCGIALSLDIDATDLNSGRVLSVAPTPPVTVTVQRGAALETTVDVPPLVTATQTVTVTATVRNTGQAAASAVSALVAAAPALFTVVTSPPGPQTIAGGASATFAWVYRAGAGASFGTFAVDAAGTDANDGAPVAAARGTSGQVVVAYPVGGTVSGLTRSGLVLRNGGEDLAVDGDGAFAFHAPVASGATYSVSVATQPLGLTCAAANGAGTVGTAPVVDVLVTCTGNAYTLSTTASPPGGGTFSCGGGTCQASYPYGTTPMAITVTANPGYAFGSWSGDCTGSGACSVTMTANRAVTATFTALDYTLSASVAPAGGGTLSCGGTACQASYPYSTTPMAITAAANPGYAFSSWSGDCTGPGACSVTMDGNHTVTANFTAVSFTLSASASPAGGGILSCGGAACQASYPYSTTPMAITAAASPGYAFASWSGDCTGPGACSVTMTANHAVTATFTALDYTLSASVAPAGGGTLSCGGAACQASYPYSTTPMAITAAANPGYAFSSWSGDCTGSGACSVTMTANRSVTATFVLRTFTFTAGIAPPGTGSLLCNGTTCQATYPYSTTPMEITAVPADGYAFKNWSGDCSGSGACSVTMSANRSVTAHFDPVPTYTLRTSVTPAGAGTLACDGGPCQPSYPASSIPMEITATPTQGYAFTSWSGDCEGAGSCLVTMDRNRTVGAEFTPTAP